MKVRSLSCPYVSCSTLCDSMDCSPPGFSVHGIFPARIMEWFPCLPPGELPDPGIKPESPASALPGGFSTTRADSLTLAPLNFLITPGKKKKRKNDPLRSACLASSSLCRTKKLSCYCLNLICLQLHE